MDATRKTFRAEEWATMNLMKFSRAKDMVLSCTCIMAFSSISTDLETDELRATLWRKTRHELPESEPCPGLHKKKYDQQVNGGDSSPLPWRDPHFNG
ncbi:hypothetical protein BTVI_14392 [Pitangus sulphuratus]|nr:hypothetical protein BTVI_14392 [Pitangus sulphuratus]